MKDNIKFNEIYVIEALRDHDKIKTGQELYSDTLVRETDKHEGLDAQLIIVSNPAELFDALEDIKKEVIENDVHPIIHIDTHGDEKGLQLPDNNHVPWEKFREILTDINEGCKNNLFIVMSVCEGFHSFKIIQPTDKTPFWGVIGPPNEISFENAQRQFPQFYRELLTSFDCNKAIEKLNEGISDPKMRYEFVSCMALFRIAYEKYHSEYCMGKNLRLRTEKLITDALKLPNAAPLKETRKYIKKVRLKKDLHKDFKKYKNIFFMIDLYPEQKNRFGIKFGHIVKKCKLRKKKKR